MFSKPKTVAQALAPFKKAITDLGTVASTNREAMNASLERIAQAERQAALVKESQGKIADAAQRESKMAEKLAQKLLSLIDEDDLEDDIEEGIAQANGSIEIVEADRPD